MTNSSNFNWAPGSRPPQQLQGYTYLHINYVIIITQADSDLPWIFVLRTISAIQGDYFIFTYSRFTNWTHLVIWSCFEPVMQAGPATQNKKWVLFSLNILFFRAKDIAQLENEIYTVFYQKRCPHILTTASFAVSRHILHSNVLLLVLSLSDESGTCDVEAAILMY